MINIAYIFFRSFPLWQNGYSNYLNIGSTEVRILVWHLSKSVYTVCYGINFLADMTCCSLFVLKVSLNTNQPTLFSGIHFVLERCVCGWWGTTAAPAARTLPQRSWAASVPTLLSQDAVAKLLTPTTLGSGSGQCCPLERFLASVFLRRYLQRIMQDPNNVNVKNVFLWFCIGVSSPINACVI